jgi:hypothetical protein
LHGTRIVQSILYTFFAVKALFALRNTFPLDADGPGVRSQMCSFSDNGGLSFF